MKALTPISILTLVAAVLSIIWTVGNFIVFGLQVYGVNVGGTLSVSGNQAPSTDTCPTFECYGVIHYGYFVENRCQYPSAQPIRCVLSRMTLGLVN